MAGSNVHASDEMIQRFDTELRQKQTLIDGIIEQANIVPRDLSDQEREMVANARGRMEVIKGQLDEVESANRVAYETRDKARAIDQAISTWRGQPQVGEVEYRTAGEYIRDMHQAAMGSRESNERLEVFHRAAAHQKTTDNTGLIPDPILGPVLNFIDAARPIVSVLGPRPLTSAIWHRPIVTQQPAVALQGSAGVAADEKAELTSQKMVIGKLTAEAHTYGGYLNLSRQNLDFSTPGILEQVVDGLASQYAIDTEAATADALATTATTAVGYGASPTAATVAGALWDAVGVAYTAVKGQGRLVLAVSPQVLGNFGPLFAPVNPQNAQSTGFNASSGFSQGVVGNISGITVVMSAGLGTTEAFLFSTAALEVYEQRIGTLQVAEPSVLGLQVAYAGYFTPLVITDDAIIPLTAT